MKNIDSCQQCGRKLPSISAQDAGGLCGRCRRQASVAISPYERFLTTPVQQLDDSQKRDQLGGALYWHNESRILELLKSDYGFLQKPPNRYSTWLGEAISYACSLAILEKLVDAGCEPNTGAQSPDKTYPLEVAVNKERSDVIAYLLEVGADPNLGRPLIYAVNYSIHPGSQLRMLELLVDGGAGVNLSHDLQGDEKIRFTVLDWAILHKASAEVIRYLKDRGAKRFVDLD